MNQSLNEIEALAKRAARGAGLSWGMAEEAGKATRWLASHGLPGTDLLADLLAQNDARAPRESAPMALEGVWTAASGPLCPLASGAALNDCAAEIASGQAIEMAQVSHPLLIVPFAAWAAIHIGVPVSLNWLDMHIATDGQRIWIDGPESQVDQTDAVSVTCTRSHIQTGQASVPTLRAHVSQSSLDRLTIFAGRTYAPATAASRLLGAGAGTTDND
ncbi:MAG: DUF3726 domain-containing protein [Paracoccaceae bacterium]